MMWIAILLRWAGRLLLGLLLLTFVVPAGARIVSESQHVVSTLQPKLCVHTRLIDEVEEWKIQRSLQMVRAMGATAIVEFFPWAYLEPTDGVPDWRAAERIVQHARNQGLRIIARLGLVPTWAQPPDARNATLNTLPRERYPDFARFVGLFAAHFAGQVDDLIIWNEPNLAFEWGYEQVSSADYANLLALASASARRANPAVTVIAAPLAPNLEPAGSPAAMNDLDYLRALYAAGAAGTFDALAMHPYGFTAPAGEPPEPDRLNFRRAELLRQIMIESGDADAPVMITEMGWNDSDRWAYGVLPAQRIEYTLAALEIGVREWDWAESLCLWVLRYPGPTFGYPDHFTLLNTEFEPNPLYLAVKGWATGHRDEQMTWLPEPIGP